MQKSEVSVEAVQKLGAGLDTYARGLIGVPAKLAASETKHYHSSPFDSLWLLHQETPFPFHSAIAGNGKCHTICID